MAEKFKREWIKKIGEDVVWICQLPRSGGTLLLRLFDSHPEFHCYPAVFGFNNEERIWPERNAFKGGSDEVLEKVFSYMNMEKFHLRGVSKQSSNMEQEIYPIYFSGRWYREIFKLVLKNKKPRNYFDAFFTALFNAWKNNQNLYGQKKYITGQMTLRRPELYQKNFMNFKAVYPNGKMIFIIRKPDDWLASAINLRVSTPFSKNPNEIMEYYKIVLRQVVEMVNDDNFIVFKFEDFVLKTKSVISALCKLLDIKWSESLTFPTFNGAPFYQNSSFKLDRKASVDPSVIGKGKTLSKSVLSAIDEECLELYRQMVEFKII